MTVPSADLTTAHLDASTDDPAQARSELKAAVDKINAIINDLGAGNTVWTNANDGAGSGLDSDLLDGQSSAYYRDAGNINAGTLALGRGGTGSTTASGARTNLGLGALATLGSISASELQSDSVSAAAIQANAVGASEIATGAVGADEIATGAVGADEIATGAVGQSEIASGAVHQAELDTSTGSVSRSDVAIDITLPGGEYGFWIQHYNDDTVGTAHNVELSTPNTAPASYSTTISLTGASGDTAYARQRYINSSPPFNLGDGEVPLFVFAIINAVGDVTSVYSADVPPWAYNGPTSITGKLDKDGNKYQYKRRVIDRESGEFELEKILVTDEIKNADMGIIPHPFRGGLVPGESIVLLDPPETEKLLLLHQSGESLNKLLHDGDLRVDNAPLVRATPGGVTAHGFRWR